MSDFSRSGTIADRIAQIRQTLPANVRLIAVSKQVSIAAMQEAYDAGIRDFGESRVQEAEAKQAQLREWSDVTWHLIGHLQANKANKAIRMFEWIHSVDHLKLAQRLDQLAAQLDQSPQVCLQVKLLPDPNKFGWTIAELLADLPALSECQHLNICGLMTIPPLGLSQSEVIGVFQQTRELAATISRQQLPGLDIQELSMGMSEDYALAVQSGATMIRLGRILFGDRT
ncbi:YggS family pyridoxal phosphate-dependent enzyme [Pantanalinema sp. GBBB05]|uniref:YggS family pyridoxal phosphate-dependent enzyme n=1 Tax=Pantanalinema sp. GBBB05 TaxID=2604139 RepID=UPI001D53DFD0|nr:YggS family pyridoxal phosphate-dependent enzyme [Pantanalinema sp. GBBB05]